MMIYNHDISSWGKFGVGLESVWGRSGVDLGSVWGRFGVGLGSLWDHFGMTLGWFRLMFETFGSRPGPFPQHCPTQIESFPYIETSIIRVFKKAMENVS